MKFWFGKKETGRGEPGGVSCDVLTIGGHDPVIGATHSSSVLITPPPGNSAAETGGPAAKPPAPPPSASTEVKPPAAADAGQAEARKPAGGGAPLQPASESQVKHVPAVPDSAGTAERPVNKAPVMPISAGKGAAVSLQAPMNSMQTGGGSVSGLGQPGGDAGKPARPVLTPVRMATPTEPVRLKPLSAAPAAPPPAPAAAPGAAAGGLRPVGGSFGLRPKEGVVPLGGAPAAPAPAAAAAPAPAAAPQADPSAAAGAAEKGVVERDADGIIRPKTDQRALYYQLMNGLYDAVLILDDQGHIVDCNARVTAMLGYSREDTWDLPIDKVITGMSNQMFEHLKRNLAENHHILIDARCFRQDGTSFAGEVGVSTLSLTRGSNIVFAIRNVDRRKNAMDEMRKGQAALEVSLAPSFVCDMDGFFVVVNQALLDAFGIPDEAQAKNVRFIDLLPDAARFFLRASCGEKLRESLRVPTPSGVPLKVELALKPVQNGQTVTGVAGSILQV